MPDIRILRESELRSIIQLDLDVVNCVEQAFASLASGNVIMPPVLSMEIAQANGEVDVKTAWVQGLGRFAIKVSPGFFDNPNIGLPSTSGLMILFSASTGMVESLLLDNGYLTDIRTAAAGAVVARHLAREDATKAAVIGTGMQAKMQLQALKLVRPISRAFIWGRNQQKAKKLAEELSAHLEIEVVAEEACENAVAKSDVIITTTPVLEPVMKADWLQPGQHVTAMGSDQPHKNELEPACILKADLYVPDRLSQTRVIGELRKAIEMGLVTAEKSFSELGDVVGAKGHGRTTPDQVTIADLTGTGVQDTAIANLAFERANKSAAGSLFNN